MSEIKNRIYFLSDDNSVLFHMFGNSIESHTTTTDIDEDIKAQVGQLEVWETVGLQPYELFLYLAAFIGAPVASKLIAKVMGASKRKNKHSNHKQHYY